METLLATAMMVAILAALATVTAQWLPNWNRGFARVQRAEALALGLERIVSDLAAAQYVPRNGLTRDPLFEGSELAATFVRTTLGPNARPGLEVIRLAEVNDGRGLAMVRTRAPYAPLPAEGAVATHLRLSDPVVLLRWPYRVSLAYAGSDRVWQNVWREARKLPRAVRITVRDAANEQTLAVSTATVIHAAAPAECIRIKDPTTCN